MMKNVRPYMYDGHKMTKTVREFNKCMRKNQYDTEALALEAAKKSSIHQKREFVVYFCAFCFKWHLTKKENEGHAG